MRKKAWIAWLLMLLCSVALMGSDSECQIEFDDGELKIDYDDDDDFWDDWFDKPVVQAQPAVWTDSLIS